MRVAAGLIFAAPFRCCAPGVAWSQAQQAANLQRRRRTGSSARTHPPPRRPSRRSPLAPPATTRTRSASRRTVEIDTTGGPGFGFEHFKELDFLRDQEVVLTFDDGPWPRTRRRC